MNISKSHLANQAKPINKATYPSFFLSSLLTFSKALSKPSPFQLQHPQSIKLFLASQLFHISNMKSGMFSFSSFEDHFQNEPHFLDSCSLCGKSLGNNSDIFMYRGNTPFCSKDCRQEQIEFDEAKDKSQRRSSSIRKSDANKDSSTGKTVRTGTVAVS